MRTGLRYFNIALITFCLFWTCILLALWFDLYSWTAFAVSGLVALTAGIPAGIAVTDYIKRRDPHWPPRRRRQDEQRQGG